MHLLNLSDKTEGELRNRLKKDLYPEEVIEEAIEDPEELLDAA